MRRRACQAAPAEAQATPPRLTSLRAASVHTEWELHCAIHVALLGGRSGIRSGHSFTCSRPSGKCPYVIHVMPLHRTPTDSRRSEPSSSGDEIVPPADLPRLNMRPPRSRVTFPRARSPPTRKRITQSRGWRPNTAATATTDAPHVGYLGLSQRRSVTVTLR
jgi:hypothetical protein